MSYPGTARGLPPGKVVGSAFGPGRWPAMDPTTGCDSATPNAVAFGGEQKATRNLGVVLGTFLTLQNRLPHFVE